MKKYNYIQTVLSHITNKRETEKIEYELFDHLDEKEKWFESCGYNEIAATEKADEYMGDGDIVGEQLDAVLKKKSAVNVASGLLFALCLITPLAIIIFALAEYINLVRSVFATEVIILSIIVMLCLISLFFGVKYSKVLNLVSSAFLTLPAFYGIKGFVINLSYGLPVQAFIRGTFEHTKHKNLLVIFDLLFMLLTAVALAAAIEAIIIIVKTRRLQNTRIHLKIKTCIKVFSTVLLIAGIVITLATLISSAKSEQEICSEIDEITAHIIDNADDFAKCNNIYDLQEWAEQNIGDYLYSEATYNDINDGNSVTYYSKTAFVTINLVEKKDGTLFVNTYLYYDDEYFLGTIDRNSADKIEKFANSKDKKLADAPFAAYMFLSKYNNGNVELELTYYDTREDAVVPYEAVAYTYTDKGFVFKDYVSVPSDASFYDKYNRI